MFESIFPLLLLLLLQGSQAVGPSEACALRFKEAPATLDGEEGLLRLSGATSYTSRALRHEGIVALKALSDSGPVYASRWRRDGEQLSQESLPPLRPLDIHWRIVASRDASGHEVAVNRGLYVVKVSYVEPENPGTVCLAFSPSIRLEKGFLVSYTGPAR